MAGSLSFCHRYPSEDHDSDAWSLCYPMLSLLSRVSIQRWHCCQLVGAPHSDSTNGSWPSYFNWQSLKDSLGSSYASHSRIRLINFDWCWIGNRRLYHVHYHLFIRQWTWLGCDSISWSYPCFSITLCAILAYSFWWYPSKDLTVSSKLLEGEHCYWLDFISVLVYHWSSYPFSHY